MYMHNYYSHLQSPQINGQHCWEEDQLKKEVTNESDQCNDAELLHGVVESGYAEDYHASQGQKVTSDGPSFLTETNSYAMLHLCVCMRNINNFLAYNIIMIV